MIEEPVLLFPSPRRVVSFTDFVYGIVRPEEEEQGHWHDFEEANDWRELDHWECRNTLAEYRARFNINAGRWIHRELSSDQIGRALQNLKFNYLCYGPVDPGLEELTWQGVWNLHFELWEPNVSDGVMKDRTTPSTILDDQCFMFHDMRDLDSPKTDAEHRMNLRYLDLWEKCLNSPKARLQESAIHGLGHVCMWWDMHQQDDKEGALYLNTARKLLTSYLERGEQVHTLLREYAKDSGWGLIL